MKKILTKLSILSILGLIMTGTAFAAVTETFTTSVVQANVVEVKASIVEQGVTITSTQVGTLGNGDTVTIVMANNSTANCAVTTATTGTDAITVTCDDGTTGGIASTTSQLAIAIGAEAAFTVTEGEGDTTPVIAGVATLAGGVDPVALIVDYIPSAATTKTGITYRASIDANNYVYVTDGSGETGIYIVGVLQPLMSVEEATTCIDNETTVRCTAATPGTAFSYSAEAVDEEVPVITSPTTINVDENQTAAITVIATDNDAVATYSIIGGYDQSFFSIDGLTGVVTFISAPNFESPTDLGPIGSEAGNNQYKITVQVSDDSANLSVSQGVSIRVVNVNESPAITSSASVSVSENQTAVTTVSASDPDAGDTVTYSISGGLDQALFNINVNTGVLAFNSDRDFESNTDADADGIYDVSVIATDGSLQYVQDISVTIADVNESPVITSSASVSVSENQTAVTTVVASDPDAGDTVTYSISGGGGGGGGGCIGINCIFPLGKYAGEDDSSFSIDASTGVLTFITAPDYENPTSSGGNNTYKVNVTATDTGLLSDTKLFSIYVTDVSESSGRSGGSGRLSSERLKEIFGKDYKKGGVKGDKKASCGFAYSRLIRYGIHGEDVKALQTLLNSLGFNTGIVDGWYGPNTYRGIKSFQTIMGILQDGIVGPQSNAKLMGKCSA